MSTKNTVFSVKYIYENVWGKFKVFQAAKQN